MRSSIKTLIKRAMPRNLIAWHGPRRRPLAALTFDDGPDPGVTPLILDTLKRRNVKATFFILTDKAAENHEIIERMIQEGHQIALHGPDHQPLNTASFDDIRTAFDRAINDARPYLPHPCRYRPPKGLLSLRMLACAWRRRWSVVMWNRDPRDYLRTTPDEVLAHFPPVGPGDIVLLHDRCPPTALALGAILDRLDSVQLLCVTIDQLLRT